MKLGPACLAAIALAGILAACGRVAPAPVGDEAAPGRPSPQATTAGRRVQFHRPNLATGSPAARGATPSSVRPTTTPTVVPAATVGVTFELVVLGELPSRASISWLTRRIWDGEWPSGPAPAPLCAPPGWQNPVTGRACAGDGAVYASSATVEPDELLHYAYYAEGLRRGRTLSTADTRRFTADTTIRVYGNLPVAPVDKARSYRLGAARGAHGPAIRETLPRSGPSPVYIQLVYGEALNQPAHLTCDRPAFTDVFVGEAVRWSSRVSLRCGAGRQVVTVSNESPVPVGAAFIAIRSEDDRGSTPLAPARERPGP